jgi:hypothetical protein
MCTSGLGQVDFRSIIGKYVTVITMLAPNECGLTCKMRARSVGSKAQNSLHDLWARNCQPSDSSTAWGWKRLRLMQIQDFGLNATALKIPYSAFDEL